MLEEFFEWVKIPKSDMREPTDVVKITLNHPPVITIFKKVV